MPLFGESYGHFFREYVAFGFVFGRMVVVFRCFGTSVGDREGLVGRWFSVGGGERAGIG